MSEPHGGQVFVRSEITKQNWFTFKLQPCSLLVRAQTTREIWNKGLCIFPQHQTSRHRSHHGYFVLRYLHHIEQPLKYDLACDVPINSTNSPHF